MAKVSLWYMHPRLYDIGMFLINGSFYLKIYKEIAHRIPENSSVLDIGAGSCTLKKYLKNCNYEAWDTNPHFVSAVQKKGINAKNIDAITNEIPKGMYDTIVISGVLHHIHPIEKKIMEKALAAAKKSVIVVEPFANPKKQARKFYRFLRNIRRKTLLERWIGEYDGRNHPDSIIIFPQHELIAFFDSFGKNTKTYIGDEIIAVYSK